MTFVPPILGTGLVTWPYDPSDPSLMEWSSLIITEWCEHPTFFSKPLPPEERRLLAAAIMANTANKHWGVWKAGDEGPVLVGVLTLWMIEPDVDATFHFLFFDRNLVGRRTLLHRFLLYCFTTLGFRRLSVTIPEDATQLLRFYRNQLGFRYEGESLAAREGYPVASATPGKGERSLTATTIAKYGSRVEGVFWRSDKWISVFRLRLLRDEAQEGNTYADRSRRSSSPDRGVTGR